MAASIDLSFMQLGSGCVSDDLMASSICCCRTTFRLTATVVDPPSLSSTDSTPRSPSAAAPPALLLEPSGTGLPAPSSPAAQLLSHTDTASQRYLTWTLDKHKFLQRESWKAALDTVNRTVNTDNYVDCIVFELVQYVLQFIVELSRDYFFLNRALIAVLTHLLISVVHAGKQRRFEGSSKILLSFITGL